MKLIIAGTRTFINYSFLKKQLDFLLQDVSEPIIVLSGKAAGADLLGEYYARVNGYAVEEYPADWLKYGNKAGPVRNELMAKAASHCVVFWDWKSPGTKSMVELAKKYQLKLRIIDINVLNPLPPSGLAK